MMFYHHHIAQNMHKSWLLLFMQKSKTFKWVWFDSEVWRDVKQMNGSATVMHTVTSDSLRVLTFLGRPGGWQCPGHLAMMYSIGMLFQCQDVFQCTTNKSHLQNPNLLFCTYHNIFKFINLKVLNLKRLPWLWHDSSVNRGSNCYLERNSRVLVTCIIQWVSITHWYCPQALEWVPEDKTWIHGLGPASPSHAGCSTQIVDTESDCSWPSPSQWGRDPAVQSWWWQGRLLVSSSVAWRGERPKIMFNDKKIWH